MSTTEFKPESTPAFRVDPSLHQALKQPATPRELGIQDSDAIVEGDDLLAGAVAHAQMLVAQNAPRRRVRDLTANDRNQFGLNAGNCRECYGKVEPFTETCLNRGRGTGRIMKDRWDWPAEYST